MALRIDLLGSSETREVLVGKLLDSADRSELETFVAQAAKSVSAPISLISLMGKRSQIFAAAQGLPPELATVGVTDRSVSLCQKTVRDNQRTEWEDASLDEDAPQGMVQAYGVRSYLGVPLVVDQVVVGSLCVVDTVPRAFSAEERQALDELGHRVSQFLQRGVSTAMELQHLREAETEVCGPVFGELRNILSPLQAGVSQASLSNAELQGALRALRVRDAVARERLDSLLQETVEATQDLDEVIGDMGSSSRRLTRAVVALESLFDRNPRLRSLSECVSTASTLAEHLTKLVGGVQISTSGAGDVEVPARSLVPVLALLLGVGARRLMDRKLRGGFRIDSLKSEAGVAIRIHTRDWERADIAHCVSRVAPFVKQDATLHVAAQDGFVELTSGTGMPPRLADRGT